MLTNNDLMQMAILSAKYSKSVKNNEVVDQDTYESFQGMSRRFLEAMGIMDNDYKNIDENNAKDPAYADLMIKKRQEYKEYIDFMSIEFLKPYKAIMTSCTFANAQKFYPNFVEHYKMFHLTEYAPPPELIYSMITLFRCREISEEVALTKAKSLLKDLDKIFFEHHRAAFLYNFMELCGLHGFFVDQDDNFVFELQEYVNSFGEERMREIVSKYPMYDLYR